MSQDKKQYDFSELDALKTKLDKLRPLDAVLHNKIMNKLHLDWTYNSNAIEGNTLSYSETQFYLNFGLTSKGHTLSEYLEMKNHKKALHSLEQVVKEKTPISEWLIKNFHAMLFENNETYEIENEQGQKISVAVLPGHYKKQNNYVLLPDNTKKWYCDPLKVIDEMQDLIKFYEANKDILHPILLAAELHARFVSIHPFVDGNGRTARIIMNIVLMQAGCPPAIIQNALKQDYYDALREYDARANLDNFIEIIEKEVIRTTQIMLNAAEGKAIYDKDDIGKRLGHFSKSMEAMDKDIGVITKRISKEKKVESIKKIRDYLYKIAEEKIAGFDTGYMSLDIENKVRLDDIPNIFVLGEALESKNIRTEEPISIDYIDSLSEGSAFEITLKSKRFYIPSSACFFAVVATKYTLCVSAIMQVSEVHKTDIEITPGKWSDGSHLFAIFIQNGVLFEDWHKEDLDNFFNDVFEQFLQMVENEAELRRVRIEEMKHYSD